MHPRSPAPRALMFIGAAAWLAPALLTPGSTAMAQGAALAPHPIPQSLQLGHDATLEQLTMLAQKTGPVGVEAARALAVAKEHIAREQEFIMPPLTLLPRLADGKVTPDMAWALPMIDRVRAEREEIFQEHTKLTDVLNALVVAAAKANDREAMEFAQSAAADSLNDLEILEPTLLLIGDLLHSKLPSAH